VHGCTDGSGAICITALSAPGTWNAGKLFVEPTDGAYVRITGVTGVTQANGVWTVNLTKFQHQRVAAEQLYMAGDRRGCPNGGSVQQFCADRYVCKIVPGMELRELENHSMQRPNINHIHLNLRENTVHIHHQLAPRGDAVNRAFEGMP
jgi:hypothetical protein